MNAHDADAKAAKAELAYTGPLIDVVALHPIVLRRYPDQLDNLKRELIGDIKKRPGIGAVMRELIRSIALYPNPYKWGAFAAKCREI